MSINVGDLVVGTDPTSGREHTAKVLEVTNQDRNFAYVRVDISDDASTTQTETILRAELPPHRLVSGACEEGFCTCVALPYRRYYGDPGPFDW